MSTDPTPPPTPVLLDLTGLPEGFVRYIEQLVRGARENPAANAAVWSNRPEDIERWSAELRAWAESRPRREGITMDDSRESMYGD